MLLIKLEKESKLTLLLENVQNPKIYFSSPFTEVHFREATVKHSYPLLANLSRTIYELTIFPSFEILFRSFRCLRSLNSSMFNEFNLSVIKSTIRISTAYTDSCKDSKLKATGRPDLGASSTNVSIANSRKPRLNRIQTYREFLWKFFHIFTSFNPRITLYKILNKHMAKIKEVIPCPILRIFCSIIISEIFFYLKVYVKLYNLQ